MQSHYIAHQDERRRPGLLPAGDVSHGRQGTREHPLLIGAGPLHQGGGGPETAAHLSDDVFPDVPLRQWLISFPFPLRYLFAAHPQAMGKVPGIVYRAISTHLIRKAGLQLKDGATGALTLIQRFGSALNLER
jgi:hypothetical protein